MYNVGPPGLRPPLLPPSPELFHYHPLPPLSPEQLCRRPLPPPDPFCSRANLQAHLASLLQNVAILRSIGHELEAIQALGWPSAISRHGSRLSKVPDEEIPFVEETSNDDVSSGFDPSCYSASHETLLTELKENVDFWPESVYMATQAAEEVLGIVKVQLKPLKEVLDGSAGRGGPLAAAKLAARRKKLTRSRKRRCQKRRQVREASRKEAERYEDADREADDWRAKEIAKVIAKRKMEKMKELAEKTSKEEKCRREEQEEMGLLLEKLHELRALRIIKLKKQGCFFPEEDDQFIQRVRAAVEEDERQAAAAVNTSATAAAILNAEESRKAAAVVGRVSGHDKLEEKGRLEVQSLDELDLSQQDSSFDLNNDPANGGEGKMKVLSKGNGSGLLQGYEGLPAEFHFYYFGSSFDMGTLIEVRHAWDAFIIPGGSRIPQYWVEPPPPADPVWASYLVKPKGNG